MSALCGGARYIFEEVWCGSVGGVGGRIGGVGPLESRGFGRGAFVLAFDESAKGVMTVNDVLFGVRRECVGLWVIGCEIGGIEGAIKVKVNATSACVIGAGVDEMEAFTWGRSHALLFVVGGGAELLMWTNGRDDGARLMRLLTLFEMCFGGRCGGCLRFEKFAGDAREVQFNMVVDGRKVKAGVRSVCEC